MKSLMQDLKLLFLVLISAFLLGGCSSLPVTWEERVENKSLAPAVNLSYSEKGNGDTLLLIHGFAEDRFTWRYLVDDLAKTHRVIALDLKGFGDSPKPKDGRYSVYDQAVIVNQFIKQHKLDNVTLVGHSMGGGIALALALMAEKEAWSVNRLIVIDAAAYKQNLPSMLRDLSTPIVGHIGLYLMPTRYQARRAYEFSFYDNNKIPPEGLKHAEQSFAQPGSRYAFMQTAKQLVPEDIEKISAQYKTITQPALIIWGYNDGVVSRKYGLRLRRDLKNSKLMYVFRAGHMPQEEKPKVVLGLMQQFLNK